MPFRLIQRCPICDLPVAECDAIGVARGVALRYLQELEGYTEAEALAALERILPRAYRHHPPPPAARRTII